MELKFELGELLERGSFGEVYKIKNFDNYDNWRELKLLGKTEEEKIKARKEIKKNYVIKIIKLGSYGIINFLEPYILLRLNNEYISESLDIQYEKGLLKILMLEADCSLDVYIKKNKMLRSEKFSIAKQLSRGVNFLHSYNILHGDIKPNNILKYDKIFKLTDFGMSKLCEINFTTDIIYTDIYRPPEIRDCILDLRSDMWALGCVIYEVWTKKKYFTYLNGEKVHTNFIPQKDNINPIISTLLNVKIEERLNSRGLCILLGVKDYEKEKSKKINFNFNGIKDYYSTDQSENVLVRKKIYGQQKTIKVSERWKEIESDICNNKKFDFDEFAEN